MEQTLEGRVEQGSTLLRFHSAKMILRPLMGQAERLGYFQPGGSKILLPSCVILQPKSHHQMLSSIPPRPRPRARFPSAPQAKKVPLGEGAGDDLFRLKNVGASVPEEDRVDVSLRAWKPVCAAFVPEGSWSDGRD